MYSPDTDPMPWDDGYNNTETASIQPVIPEQTTQSFEFMAMPRNDQPNHQGLCVAMLLVGFAMGGLGFIGVALVTGLL